MLLLREPWSRQPQSAVRVAGKYSDAALAWLAHTPRRDIAARYQSLFTQQGAISQHFTARGGGKYSNTYTANNRLTGASANPDTENWPGVTVIASLAARNINGNEFPSIVSWMPVPDFHGGFNLSVERDSGGAYFIIWRAGDSTTGLSPTTYGTVPVVSHYAPGDNLTIVAGWDKSTIWLVVERNGALASNSNAHSFGWRNSSSLFSLLGYERPLGQFRTTPHAVNGVVVVPRDLRNEAYSLAANPWQMFEPRRIWVPVEVASTGSAITQADGVATASTLAGTSTAASTPTSANGAATASSVGGASTAAATVTAADGAATASSMAGTSVVAAAFTQADGVATTSTLQGTDGASLITQANGTATAATMAGASTAAAAITQANGVATGATMVGLDAAAVQARRRAGGAVRKRYLIKGKFYWLTDDELSVLIAQELADIGRRDVKVAAPKSKPRVISAQAWAAVKPLARLEALAAKMEPDDDEDELILMMV